MKLNGMLSTMNYEEQELNGNFIIPKFYIIIIA